jgi:PHD/YefM family antitoxin component YafN of YafNO toxin-antitoxin module
MPASMYSVQCRLRLGWPDRAGGLARKPLLALVSTGADADPVLIGAHRKPQGVLLSVEAFEALSGRAARRTAVASATGSIEAEGLQASNASDRDTEAYVTGDLDVDTLVARAIARHRHTSERRAG